MKSLPGIAVAVASTSFFSRAQILPEGDLYGDAALYIPFRYEAFLNASQNQANHEQNTGGSLSGQCNDFYPYSVFYFVARLSWQRTKIGICIQNAI